MIEAVILVLSSVVSAATGIFAYARNPKHVINRIYAGLTISLIFFSLTNYLSLKTTDRLLYIRAVIFFSTIVVACLYYLVVFLGEQKKKLSRLQYLGVALTAIVAALDLSPFVFSGLNGTVNPVPIPNFAVPLYAAHLLFFLSSSFILLLKRVFRAGGSQQLQYLYILIGILPLFLLAPITGFVLPVVFKNPDLIFLSPIYGATFVCFVGYAIVKHRLFDIHFFAIRSAAYLMTVFMLAVFCVTPAVLLIFYFLGFPRQLWLVVLSVLMIVTSIYVLQYLRNLFDKMTSKIFYRYYYDPQDVLDRLSSVLVHTTDANELREKSAKILSSALKSNEFHYVLFNSEVTADVLLSQRLTAVGRNVISVDNLGGIHSGLMQVLREKRIALAVRIRTKHEELGYMVLSYKQSGEVYSARDIRLLSTAADEIAISLQNALRFEEIERFNETLQVKVADATRRLSQSNRKLKKLNDTKDDFIGMASHQLRTPLTSVKGYLSLVLDEDAGPITATQRKLLQQAFTSSQRVIFLIADLLNVSRLKTGKFVIERTPTNLSKMILDEIAQLREAAASRDITVAFDKPAHFPSLPLDEAKTRQVIMNFLDNAIYYGRNGGHITIKLDDLPKSVELRIIDDGIGVPIAEKHHLWTKFYRAKNAQRARPDGTGLGLYMARKVVVAQGGTTIFDSTEDKGSTFGFAFPKAMPIEASSEPVGVKA